ncbi:hypothetical protein SAMN02745148_02891 [Modicisalibacter ilicicola DSM 19980]|uniref:DUF2062 domain-containing protein n=1 Tax=Modicisalibacter ilicicola DSM 19980 TaxID=1121942 RepID=A0A1M5CCG4_9GAMM|nr:DUF2062 domain-containing protein [Halomonas ilicicola]SHF52380.1 hypothetical protein SAMN02745148_02891 [Halomonas ilicicola DSM 19980]
MLRRLLQRHMPHQETLKRNRSLRFMGPVIANTSLWVLTRRSVGNAFMVGLFCALLPIPFQMALAACGAWLLRCNLPLSVGLVWLTNPLTMPLIFYGNYRLGTWLLDTPVQPAPDHLSTHWFAAQMVDILPILFVGSLVSAMVIGVLSNVLLRLVWRWQVARSWKRRARRRCSQREALHQNTLAKPELVAPSRHPAKRSGPSRP